MTTGADGMAAITLELSRIEPDVRAPDVYKALRTLITDDDLRKLRVMPDPATRTADRIEVYDADLAGRLMALINASASFAACDEVRARVAGPRSPASADQQPPSETRAIPAPVDARTIRPPRAAPWTAPRWRSGAELRAILNDIDALGERATAEQRQFYADHLSDLGQLATGRPIPPPPPPPPTRTADWRELPETDWTCDRCGFINVGAEQSGGGPLDACRSCLDPLVLREPQNTVRLKGLSRDVSESEVFNSLRNLVQQELDRQKVSEPSVGSVLHKVKVTLDRADKACTVTFKRAEHASLTLRSVRAMPQVAGCRVRVAFVAASSKPQRAAEEDAEHAEDADEGTVETEPAWQPPLWTSCEELQKVLEDIDSRWESACESEKAFYNDKLPTLQTMQQATAAPATEASPVPTATAAEPFPAAPSASIETVPTAPSSATLSLKERIALKRQQVEAAAASKENEAAATEVATIPVAEIVVARPLGVIRSWPRFWAAPMLKSQPQALLAASQVLPWSTSRSAYSHSSIIESDGETLRVPPAAVAHATKRKFSDAREGRSALGHERFVD